MPLVVPAVDRHSAASAKIALFRSLFRGRDDVYPRRFESRKTGKSGYAPACANEWLRGICEKPRIKLQSAPIVGSFRSPTMWSAGICAGEMERVSRSSLASTRCSWTRPATSSPSISTRQDGRQMPWRSCTAADVWALSPLSSNRDRAAGDTSGCSSKRLFPPSLHADSGHISSPRRWRIALTSGWTPPTDYSRVKTPCRKAVSET